jgi:hypothetical protein
VSKIGVQNCPKLVSQKFKKKFLKKFEKKFEK